MARTTKIEHQQRIEQIFDLICEGKKFHHIVKFAAHESWGIGNRQLKNLYRAAGELVQASIPDRVQQVAELHLKLADQLIKADAKGDTRGAIQAIRLEGELLGAFPSKNAPAKVQSQKGMVEEVLADPEMLKLLKESQSWTPPMLQIAEPIGEQA